MSPNKVQRRLCCLAIGPKRYCLVIQGDKERFGPADIVDAKESGLKIFMDPSPTQNEKKNQDFVKDAWLNILNGDRSADMPQANQPIVYEQTISTAFLWNRFQNINRGKPYPQQVKPDNFILQMSTSASLGTQVAPVLIAPFDPNPDHWLGLEWLDYQHPDRVYIPARDHAIEPQTISEYIENFRYHPEFPYIGVDGLPCSDYTRGVLTRREIVASGYVYSGMQMVAEDDVNATNPDFDQVQLVYGKTEIPLALVLRILRDVPRDFAVSALSDLPEDEVGALLRDRRTENPAYQRAASSRRKIERWLSGKVSPNNVREPLGLAISYVKSVLKEAVENLTTEEVLQAYLNWREQIYRGVQAHLNQISDHQARVVLGLNRTTIDKFKNGEYVRPSTIMRVNQLIQRLAVRDQ